MRISNTLGEDEWSWTSVLRHLREDRQSTADVEFRCRGGKTIAGNLLLLSRSSRLLKNIVAGLPAYQALGESDGKLKITFPDVDCSTVKQWTNLVYSGSTTVSGQRKVNAFTEFLRDVIRFTGNYELSPDHGLLPFPDQQQPEQGTGIRILNFGSLVEPQVIDITDPEDATASVDDLVSEVAEYPPPPPPPPPPAGNEAPGFQPDVTSETLPNEQTLLNQHPSSREGVQVEKVKCPECQKAFAHPFAVYQHSSLCHYLKLLKQKCSSRYNEETGCDTCKQKLSCSRSRLVHFGARHRMILQFMDEETRKKYLTLGLKASVGNKVKKAKAKRAEPGTETELKGTKPEARHKPVCPECPKVFGGTYDLFRHSSLSHYYDMLKRACSSFYDEHGGCGICSVKIRQQKKTSSSNHRNRLISHLGATHKMILKFMDDETRKKYEAIGATNKRRKIS